MSSKEPSRIELLQGSLDLIVLQALAIMGPLHSYALSARLAQVADAQFPLKQGTLYPSLVRMEQRGWILGTWQKTETHREAKYYAITRAGRAALSQETARWHRFAEFVNKLLSDEA